MSTMQSDVTRIVLIDDEERTIHVLSSWLASLGYDVRAFTSADSGIEGVAREGADVVIVGSHVADRAGAQIARAIREACGALVPAFVGLMPSGEAHGSSQPAFDAVVRKPCSLDTLLTEISRLAPAHG